MTNNTLLSIRIPKWVIEKYKEKSKITGQPYQRLMNLALKIFIDDASYTQNQFTTIVDLNKSK